MKIAGITGLLTPGRFFMLSYSLFLPYTSSVIKVKDLAKEYFAGETLFQGVTFVLSKNEKVALTGPNGCGKTTLLKIIAGLEEKTGGSVLLESEKLGFLPQELDLPLEILAGEFLEKIILKMGKKHLVDALLSRLGFSNFDEYTKIGSLSGGEQMKLKLLEVLADEPTSLLLDEPTNHLDIDGILWFEDFIKNFKGNVLMISHDRSFINNTVSRVFGLENKEFHVFEGNYDTFQEQKFQFLEKKKDEYTRFLKKKKKLEDLLALAHKIVGSKTGAVKAAKSRFKREIEENKVSRYEIKKMENLRIAGDTHSGKLIVKAEKLAKSFDGKPVISDVDFEIRGKEKIWLFGPNGAGKSTIVKLIYSNYLLRNDKSPENSAISLLKADSGDLRVGERLKIGYFAQSNEPINLDLNVLDYFLQNSSLIYDKAYSHLKNFLFEREALNKKLKMLSPGERARLKLSVFACGEYDFLILDEPTNHLDISAKEAVESALREYQGALLLVSHDRYFVSEVDVGKVMELRDGGLKIRYL